MHILPSTGHLRQSILLWTELKEYIKSQYLQYFGKSKILLDASEKILDTEGLLYSEPYIESFPTYETIHNGIQKAEIPNWLKEFFAHLPSIYSSPFSHQVRVLKRAFAGDCISTGTGSELSGEMSEARNQNRHHLVSDQEYISPDMRRSLTPSTIRDVYRQNTIYRPRTQRSKKSKVDENTISSQRISHIITRTCCKYLL